ncbi:MAG: serine protein kinase RIO, partial [Methanosarcinales archaeon]|nr:serine protein kinase RIO [Methanosarcinales archaeon]
DLNEFNTLIDTNFEPIIIDVGQSVMLEHPRAEEFLMRDIRNIMRFFKKYGIKITEEEMISRITRADPSDNTVTED